MTGLDEQLEVSPSLLFPCFPLPVSNTPEYLLMSISYDCEIRQSLCFNMVFMYHLLLAVEFCLTL